MTAPKEWPEWVKAAFTAAIGGAVAVFGMGLAEGGRREKADATALIVQDHEPRIKTLELQAASDAQWKAWLRQQVEEMRSDIKALRK
jgi:hypothetical protein